MARTKDPALERQRKAQIVATVYRLLVEGSFHEATLQRVAKEAGVSKGLVTYYFPNKDALILETIARYHGRQRELLEGIAASRLPVEERLRLLVDAAFPSRRSVTDELRFQTEVWSFAKTRPEVWEAIARSYRAFKGACQALVEVGHREGYVTAEDLDDVYLLIHALVDGLTFQLAVDESLAIDAVKRRLLGLIEQLLGVGPR